MHFSLISTMLLVSSVVLAAPAQLETRDDKVVRYNIMRINKQLEPLDTMLGASKKPRSYRNDAELERYFRSVYDAGNLVVNELLAGAEDVRRNSPKVTDTEIVGLTFQIGKMDTALGRIVNSIIASKRDVEKIGRKREVYDLFVRARNGVDDIFTAVNSKTSATIARTVGDGLKAKFVNNLDKAVKAFR